MKNPFTTTEQDMEGLLYEKSIYYGVRSMMMMSSRLGGNGSRQAPPLGRGIMSRVTVTGDIMSLGT
jgi:hypothetical protein